MNYGKTKISNYVIDRNVFNSATRNSNKTIGSSDRNTKSIEKCEDIDVLLKSTDFPYRNYYLGNSNVKINLEKIFEIEPIVRKEKWTIPEGKIVNKIPLFNDLFYLSDTVITSVDNHWNYDQVIDYYSEKARVKTPGYGEKYSQYEYWNNPKLHSRWITNKDISMENARELLYEKIQEARPAYSLVSKSLYYALMNLNKKESYKILDIAAYGERAIAAASLKNVIIYDGIDPNYDLINGHDLLSMDLELMNPDCNIRFIHIGMEDFKTNRKYDIITYSPPPFNTEPYGNNQETQSYIKYPTFEEYLCCFLTELIYKAKYFSYIGTIFSFTALDRNPIKFPPKIKDKELISENLELIYVEALLLIISCFGFEYTGAIGLASGAKKAGVPWWTFKYNNTIEPFYIQLLKENYSSIFKVIAPRIISNYQLLNGNIHPILEDLTIVNKTNKYYISSFLQKESSIILELIRLQIQQYIIEIVSNITGLRNEKVRVILGRYLMMKSINATYQMPWKSGLYVDPVFPVKLYKENINDPINDQIIKYLIEQKVNNDLSNIVVYKYKYWFGSYECIGLDDLYNTVANYIQTIPLSNVEINVENENSKTIIYGNNIAVDILKRIPKGHNTCGITNRLWRGIPDIELLPYLRYETLGAHGHQYTRPKNKTDIIERIFRMPVIDIYASMYNNQSDLFCSIYPDIEKKSIGSAFCLRMNEGAYLANPVDVPIFLEKSVNVITEDLHRAKRNDKNLLVSMNFTVWTDTENYFINDFTNGVEYSKLFKKSFNKGLNLLSDSDFILAVYILDKKKFPSMLLDKTGNRDNTISVGIILGSKKDTIDYNSIIELVEDKKYIQYRNNESL